MSIEQTISEDAADVRVRFTDASHFCGGTTAEDGVYCLRDPEKSITIEARNRARSSGAAASAVGPYILTETPARRSITDTVSRLEYGYPRNGPGSVTVGVDVVDGRNYKPHVHVALSFWDDASGAHAWYSEDF